MLTKKRFDFLDGMRAVAVFMVVSIHGLTYVASLSSYQIDVLSLIVFPIAVPVFFLVDGYLFANACLKYDIKYTEYIKKSAFRLLVPWLIFSTAYCFLRYVFELSGVLENNIVVDYSFIDIIKRIYMSVYAPQMYFLLSLFLIRAMVPVLRRLFIAPPVHFSLIAGLFLVGSSIVFRLHHLVPLSDLLGAGGQEPVAQAVHGLQFYVVGVILFRLKESISLKSLFFISFVVMSAYLSFNGVEGKTGFFVFQYSYLMVLFSLFSLVGSHRYLNFIGSRTMGIYLLHTPVLLFGVSKIIGMLHVPAMALYLIVVSSTFALSLLAMMLIQNVPFGNVLFGIPLQSTAK